MNTPLLTLTLFCRCATHGASTSGPLTGRPKHRRYSANATTTMTPETCADTEPAGVQPSRGFFGASRLSSSTPMTENRDSSVRPATVLDFVEGNCPELS